MENSSEAITADEYAQPANMDRIVDKIKEILAVEAPISHEGLIKRTQRAMGLSRSSKTANEVTEGATKKLKLKANRQNGMKFYWNENQNPETYALYRVDANLSDRRNYEDICQQELKNVVCYTLEKNGPMSKDALIKDTIRNMGYSRSTTALIEAIERGIKYGRKTGEIVTGEGKKLALMEERITCIK